MAKWIDPSDNKLGFWFESLADVAETKEKFIAVFDYLLEKYKDKPNRPILTKLDVDKFNSSEYNAMDN